MARNIDNGRLSVMLWGQEIGQLCWNPAKGNSYFFFSQEYLASGLDIAPLTASSKSPVARFAIYGNTDSAKYQKLPPFIADSLPDDWGNTLFDQWFAEHHYHEKDKTPLAKLSFVGSRAMGALEFIPCSEEAFSANEKLMIPELYELAKKIEQDREHAIISPEETLTQKALMAVGTSAGGRFKKAIIAMDECRNIFSGQTSAREDRKYYILKFNTPEFCLSEIEKTWYDLAIKAGITMMPSRLIEVEGIHHFLTERFDRRNGEKVFTQTLAAVNPEAYCYEDLFSTCRQLSISQDELNELYLRMVFNILSNNTDDHAKNFSFIMEKDGSWHLSPAYDLCFIFKTAAVPEKHHEFSIRGKYEDITIADLLAFAAQNDIKNPAKYIDRVKDSLRDFSTLATSNGVAPFFIDIMESRLRELSPDVFVSSIATSNLIRFEMTDSGNIHLYATIDGQEKRRVFTKKNEQYEAVLGDMKKPLSRDEQKEILKRYFRLLVLFDLDGTLLDTIRDLGVAVNYALEAKGLPVHGMEEFPAMVGRGIRNLVKRAMPEGLREDEAAVDDCLSLFKEYYSAHIDVYTRPYKGMPELLGELHGLGIKMAVVSNKFQEGAEFLVKEFFGDIPFVCILGNREGHPLKPNPAIVEEVLNTAGMQKSEAVLVGDSIPDMMTAAGAGIDSIAVTWGYCTPEELAGNLMAGSPSELKSLLII